MHVVATAGHVDHGKSTLVRALTGMEPDRWAEEQRRGMTIDLGYAWTTLPSGATLAFVDVPGHERFTANMLAGLGPVRAVLLVVAADEGWRQQSVEHLAAVDALGIGHGVVVVTRADRADPGPALRESRDRLAGTSLAGAPAVAVSAVREEGLDELRAVLDDVVAQLLPPDATARARLWVDRSFGVRGRGTVVTGTLTDGSLRVGDAVSVGPGGRGVTVRGIESLRRPVDVASARARVAVNLRGADVHDVRRGDVLVPPGAWFPVVEADVLLTGSQGVLPRTAHLHVGSMGRAVDVRRLGPGAARLRLPSAAALAPGDRGVLLDPGGRRVIGGVVVADVDPPPLGRRGAAARRAAELADGADGATYLERVGAARRAELAARGLSGSSSRDEVSAGEWLVSPGRLAQWRAALRALLVERAAADAAEPTLPTATVMHRLALPDPALLDLVVEGSTFAADRGRVGLAGNPAALAPEEQGAVDAVVARLSAAPYDAPAPAELTAAGLTPRVLRVAVRAGTLTSVGGGVYLRPAAVEEAARRLGALPTTFSIADARAALGASRRVAVPLIDFLAAAGRISRRR